MRPCGMVGGAHARLQPEQLQGLFSAPGSQWGQSGEACTPDSARAWWDLVPCTVLVTHRLYEQGLSPAPLPFPWPPGSGLLLTLPPSLGTSQPGLGFRSYSPHR